MSESEFKRTRKQGRTISDLKLSSPIADLINATIDDKAPSLAVAWTLESGQEVVVVALVSDADGAMAALRAYEQGRDAFALKTANAVVKSIADNGLPEKMNVVLHS